MFGFDETLFSRQTRRVIDGTIVSHNCFLYLHGVFQHIGPPNWQLMVQNFLSHKLTHSAVAVLTVFGVLVCVFPHAISSLSWVVNYAVQLMVLYLIAGLAFLMLKQPRLTFLSFGGCLMISFFLKFSIKNNSIDRWREAILSEYQHKEETIEFSAAQFNLSNATSPDNMLKAFRASGADLVSVHEVTPGWSQWLQDSLNAFYPYHHAMVDLGIFGMALFSKHPLVSVDTFYYEEIPNLRVCLQKNGLDLCVVSVHTEPALNDYSLRRLEGHLETLTAQVGRMDMPLLVLGDFNSVSWSKELQRFMDSAKLLESRSGFMDRQRSFWDVPVDHIFHSPRLGCADFSNLSDQEGHHLGIMATFQTNSLATHVKKTAQ